MKAMTMRKVESIDARYGAYRIVGNLVRAQEAIEAARVALTGAWVDINDSGLLAELLPEVNRMRDVLYADTIPPILARDGLAWDVRSLVLRAGQVVCNKDDETL